MPGAAVDSAHITLRKVAPLHQALDLAPAQRFAVDPELVHLPVEEATTLVLTDPRMPTPVLREQALSRPYPLQKPVDVDLSESDARVVHTNHVRPDRRGNERPYRIEQASKENNNNKKTARSRSHWALLQGQAFQPFHSKLKNVHSPNLLKRKVSEVVRIGSITIFHLSKLWSQVLHTVWCNISGEAAGETWNWSLLGVKGLSVTMSQCLKTSVRVMNGRALTRLCVEDRLPEFIPMEPPQLAVLNFKVVLAVLVTRVTANCVKYRVTSLVVVQSDPGCHGDSRTRLDLNARN